MTKDTPAAASAAASASTLAGASADSSATVLVDGQPVALHVVEAGLACCAVEQQAATALVAALPAEPAGSAAPPILNVLVVSGTVTDAMAPLLAERFGALPEPRTVLSFGACAATGGPYWDSPVVMNGIDQLLPVETYVPGCPPRPEAFVAGLRQLVAVRAGSSGVSA